MEIDSNIPMVLLGDDHKIRQILVNLVGNAIKFTNNGEINIAAALIPDEKNLDFIRISFTVRDTGIGIPTDKINGLFHSFNHMHPQGYEEMNRGTGLGLSICKRLTELMDGHIWLAGTSEKGSTFTFEIKLPALSQE
ncbi:ATP-binding protein [Peribacillus sp. NJ4]|uniref:ATP-binding protein n=1 Tax=Peribacillus sp. NJ4 TaxID=3055862 RepID=UPI0025A29932|nr:ATP-binding protein [Peribacillus sp. NJ4]MDM5213100.1 ATP-binding protein [Peribacillus sp. NJ4]